MTNPRRWLKHALWLLPLLLLLLLLSLWGGGIYLANRAVQAEIAAARALGYPMNAEELRDWYPKPDSPHAGEIYERAFAAYVRDEAIEADSPIFGGEIPPRGQRWPDDTLAAAEQYLALNAEALQLLHQAAAMGPAWFEINFDAGVDAPLPHVRQLRRAGRLLTLEARWRAHTGQLDAAIDSAVTLWQLGAALRDEPVLISQLLVDSLGAYARTTTEEILADAEFSGEQLARLADAIERNQAAVNLTRGLAGDRVSYHNAFLQMGQTADLQVRFLKLVGAWQRDHAFYLQFAAVAIASVEDAGAAQALEQLEADIPRWALISSPITQVIGDIVQTAGQRRSAGDVARAAVAAARFERDYGRLPNSLDDLVPDYLPAIPADPFADGPLRYRRTQSGAIIYSVGFDGEDHGGREIDNFDHRTFGRPPMLPRQAGTDLTFTLGDAQRELWPEQWTSESRASDTAESP